MTNSSARALAAVMGILLSGGAALAQEPAADQASAEQATETRRDMAREANERAAEEAAEAVQAASRLDLDIRLIGPTSVKIASDRKVVR